MTCSEAIIFPAKTSITALFASSAKYTATKAPLSNPANVTAACIASRNFAGFSRSRTAFSARRSPSSAICFIFVSFIEITEISALEKIAFNMINTICNTIMPTIFSKKSSMYVVYTLRVFPALTYIKKIYKKIPRTH